MDHNRYSNAVGATRGDRDCGNLARLGRFARFSDASAYAALLQPEGEPRLSPSYGVTPAQRALAARIVIFHHRALSTCQPWLDVHPL